MTAPVIVTALFGAEDFAMLDALRRAHFPATRNIVPAHLTLIHHLAPSLADELKHRLSRIVRHDRPPPARLAGLVGLGGGVAFRVESGGLEAIHSDLANAFSGMLTPQDSAPWRPHVTIQNKVDPHAAKQLLQELKITFKPRSLAIAGIACWHYRGGPWEPLAEYRFR